MTLLASCCLLFAASALARCSRQPPAQLRTALISPLVSGAAIACSCMQVNYVGKSANLYEDAGYKLHGSAYVINQLLGTSWLWDRVRVSGGAYGGFSSFDSHSGLFTFLSYRDPNLLKTADVYDGTADFLRQLQLDKDALTKVGAAGAAGLGQPCETFQDQTQDAACTTLHAPHQCCKANILCHGAWACMMACVPVPSKLGPETWDEGADSSCVLQAIIGTIGDIDSYQLPDAKGSSAFSDHILGNTHEKRQARREEVLGTSLQDFRYSPWLLHLFPCSCLITTDPNAVKLESQQA